MGEMIRGGVLFPGTDHIGNYSDNIVYMLVLDEYVHSGMKKHFDQI